MKAGLALATTVIFDGDCAMCSAFIGFCYGYFKHTDINVSPLRELSSTDAATLGVRFDECREELHCVTPAGTILKGARACNYLLRPVPILGHLLSFFDSNPVLLAIESYCYRQVARNRRKLSCIFGKTECTIL